MLVPKVTSEERLWLERWWISPVEIMARNNTKCIFPTEILKEQSTSNFSHESSMPRIRFSPGLKPAEFEQVAELMCYASGGLNTSFISLICSLPDICRLIEKEVHTISPHLSHRYTFKENFSISHFSWKWSLQRQWIITELLPVKMWKKKSTMKTSLKSIAVLRVTFDQLLSWKRKKRKSRIINNILTDPWFS